MKRKGRSLEKLVAHLEVVLGNENVTITSPRRLRDVVTKRLREHDVIVETRNGHHVSLIAFECRDRSRPVGSDAVEAFAKKCEHTNVNKGIIVSAMGFRSPAIEKARFLGIDCYGLEQMERFITPNLVMLCEDLYFRSCYMTSVSWHFKEMRGRDGHQCAVEIGSGEPVNAITLTERARMELDRISKEHEPGIHKANIKFDCEDIWLHDKTTNERVKVSSMIASIDYEIRQEISPLRHFKYSNKTHGNELASVSIAKNTIGDKTINLVFHTNLDGSVSLSVVAEQGEN